MGVIGFSRSVLVAAALCAPALLTSSIGFAADDAASSYPPLQVCDPNYYTVLQKRAQAEIQREIQVNNTVITKPASVLALSCFDSSLTAAASGGGTFSDTNGNTDALKNAINNALGNSLTSYHDSNFKENDSDQTIEFESGKSSTSCGRLMGAWKVIKYGLADGTYTGSLDDFRTTTEGGTDIRGEKSDVADKLATTYKEGLETSSDLAEGKKKYGDDYFDTARPNFCAYDPKSGTDALADSKVCAVKDSGDKKCSDMAAVPTGVAISYSNGTETNNVWSYACLNPGCYFDMKANVGSIKVSGNSTPPTGMKCAPKPSN